MRLSLVNLRHRFSRAARARQRADQAFDRRWGTDTSGGIAVRELGFPEALVDECRRYDPSDEAMLRDPVAMLDIDPAQFDFVDYGAGKGRMVMLAAEMGFRTVTGVELSERLCETARKNFERFASRNPGLPHARLFEGDAASFVPDGPAILAYLYNPFGANVMTAVRTRLEEALRAGTRQVVVIYANAEHGSLFAEAPGWRCAPNPRGVSSFVAEAADFSRHPPAT
ncbi:MAG: class I SAM-dependent methyltransferase [Sphingomonas sp.]|uniref:methyltransferase domain-containing protein n=1 Tax=Sphingomonas sp. TaxID=28214 RepID=UPI0025D7E589|nr:methyltransferase domain-containing protein [Sphingomonas sp.]MBX3563790.1 class I SAM-dependent methyltransferase [Sphingomonas sp.]